MALPIDGAGTRRPPEECGTTEGWGERERDGGWEGGRERENQKVSATPPSYPVREPREIGDGKIRYPLLHVHPASLIVMANTKAHTEHCDTESYI